MTLRFSTEDHARVAAAIRRAETTTSGEIYAVFARRADDYRFIAAAVALALSLIAGFAVALLARLLAVPLPTLAVEAGQLLGAIVLFARLMLSPRLAMLFVPVRIAHARAAALARAQFLAHNLHATSERTGVLLFVSEAERYAEIVADAGIAARVESAEWEAIIALLIEAARSDRLADGFIEAIARAGALLAEAFPPGTANRNEIPDRLVEI